MVSVLNKDYTQTDTVASGGTERVSVVPPSDERWQVLMLRVQVDSDADATSGTHEIRIENESGGYEYCRYSSTYDTAIWIRYGSIRAANDAQAPGSDSALQSMIPNLIAEENEGLSLFYKNDTDVAQENQRLWRLRVLEIPNIKG